MFLLVFDANTRARTIEIDVWMMASFAARIEERYRKVVYQCIDFSSSLMCKIGLDGLCLCTIRVSRWPCDPNQTLADHSTRWVAEIISRTRSISMNLYVHAIAYEHVV
jgi:hypothetical protein